MTDQTTTGPPQAAMPEAGPKGIGGWLILPILQLAATAALTAFELIRALADPEVRAGLSLMIEGNLPENLRGLAYFTFADAAIGIAAIALSVVCFIKVAGFKRSVPTWMTLFYAFTALAYGFEWYMTVLYPMLEEPAQGVMTSAGQFIGACLRAAIWITYFWVSKRVKNTFVN